jgi:hypothetical protein
MPAIVREAPKPRPRRSGADETLAVPEDAPRPITLPFSKATVAKGEGEPPPAAEAPPPDPPATAAEPPEKKAPAKELLVSSPPTDAAPAAKPAPPKAPEKKVPPKVDVASKLYGPGKKR